MNVAEDKGVNINADNSNKQTNMKQSTQQTSVMHINTVSSNTYQGDALNQNPMFQETGGFVLNIGKNK